jgi:hypothetical protein
MRWASIRAISTELALPSKLKAARFLYDGGLIICIYSGDTCTSERYNEPFVLLPRSCFELCFVMPLLLHLFGPVCPVYCPAYASVP